MENRFLKLICVLIILIFIFIGFHELTHWFLFSGEQYLCIGSCEGTFIGVYGIDPIIPIAQQEVLANIVGLIASNLFLFFVYLNLRRTNGKIRK